MRAELNTDENFLAPFVDAARSEIPDERLAAAAERIRSDIPEPKPIATGNFSWLRLGAAAITVTLALALGQIFVPGNGGAAFADAQQWFASFRTVHVKTTMTGANMSIIDLDVWALSDGHVRVEQAGIVHILNPVDNAMYTLLPGRQYFKLPLEDAPPEPQPLDWFEDIRSFKGEAEKISDGRDVNGVIATGYRLQADGTDLTLWVEPDSHRPLLLEGQLPGGLRMQSTLQFDTDLQPSLFVVPPGFRRVEDSELE